jgi:undecaprenyl-diphosphatase
MVDLSKPWPLGLGEKRWWVTVAVVLAALAVALVFDHQISVWAVGLPATIGDPLGQITRYGESDWILYPAAFLFIITVAVAMFVRWKLMRSMLWQFAYLYAFIFVGVGLPSLISTLVKRLIGRGRPTEFDTAGLFTMRWNWTDFAYQSFPSGHATTAFALAAVVGFISERWFYPALVFAAAIGFSRITEGVHYASDVLVGALLGLLGAYAVRWFFARQGWMFTATTAGCIAARPMSSLRRYLQLKRRDTAPKPQPDRP